jgi:hypothetical protein
MASVRPKLAIPARTAAKPGMTTGMPRADCGPDAGDDRDVANGGLAVHRSFPTVI